MTIDDDISGGPEPGQVWAIAHITGDHARTFKPGERIDERLPTQSLLERGLATTDPVIASAAAAAHAASEHNAAQCNRPRPFSPN